MFIDTSGFFSVNDKAEKHHAEAHELYNQAWFRMTTNYVLDEFVALATARKLSREKILAFSEEILVDETIEIVWIDEDLHTKAVELLKNRKDKLYSLCDAVSFVVMRKRNITEALTTDHHFEQEGFVRHRLFVNLCRFPVPTITLSKKDLFVCLNNLSDVRDCYKYRTTRRLSVRWQL